SRPGPVLDRVDRQVAHVRRPSCQANRATGPRGLVDAGDDRDRLPVGLQVHPELLVTVQRRQEVLVLATMRDGAELTGIGAGAEARARGLGELLDLVDGVVV